MIPSVGMKFKGGAPASVSPPKRKASTPLRDPNSRMAKRESDHSDISGGAGKDWNTPESVRRLYYNSNSNSMVIPELDRQVRSESQGTWYNKGGEVQRANTIKRKISRLASKIAHELEFQRSMSQSMAAPHEQEYLQTLLEKDIKDWQGSQKRSPKQQLDDLFAGADDFASSLMYITIPFVKSPWNYIFGIINFILPGIGTILATLFGSHYTSLQLILGIFQLLTSPLLIGWFFSIAWGLQIITKRPKNNRQAAQLTNEELQKELKRTIIRSIVIGQTGEPYHLDETGAVDEQSVHSPGYYRMDKVREQDEYHEESSSNFLNYEDYKAKQRVANFFNSDDEK